MRTEYQNRMCGAEQLFLAAYALWLTATDLKLTMWAYVAPASRLFSCMQLAAYLLLGIQFLVKPASKKHYGKKDLAGVLLILFCSVLVWHAGRTNRQIFPVVLFLYFSADIPYKKILKCSVAIQLAVMAFAIATSGCGLIEDVLWYEGDRVRHSLGYDYCGYPAHIMLFVTMSWLCIRGNAHLADAAVLLALNGVIFTLTDSRSDLLLAVLGIAGAFLWGRDFTVEPEGNPAGRCLSRVFCHVRIFLAKFGFLIAFVISVVVQFFYNSDSTFWYRINETLNGRLQLGHSAIQEYGFSLFGRAIHWYGQGSLRLGMSDAYNYVDNSFLKELLTYGWVFAVLLLIGFYFTGKKLAQQKEWMLCWALLITIAYSVINAQLCVLSFQPFILLPGMLFASEKGAGNSGAESPHTGSKKSGETKELKELKKTEETAGNSRMRFLNTEIDNVTFEEALTWIEAYLDDADAARLGGYIVTPNVDHIVRLETDQALQKAYESASLVLTDGQPLIWISKWLGTPIKEKISGSDLFPRVCQLAAKKGYRMYFLGAGPGVADMAAQKLKTDYPGLQVVGTFSPAYGFEKDESQIKEVWQKIHQAKPDILIAALGTPKQEIFLWESREELNGMLAFGIGAGLDFAAGNVKRAPHWMQKCGLEWFYRLCHEPKRLFKRYLVDGLRILPIVWKYRKEKG